MSKDLLLVGSVPLNSAEQVMEMFGAPLGPYLQTVPDGEVGDRRYWILKLCYQVFNGHPQMETTSRPAPDGDVERLIPRDSLDSWIFKLKPGVEQVHFGEPGWRLGYTKDAINSYFVFKTLRERGVIAPHLRFQVSLPSVNSAVAPTFFPDRADLEKVRAGFLTALKAEVMKIVEMIPNDDLAIQWDCSWEVTDVYGAIPGFSRTDALDRNVPQFAELSRDIPERVMLGYHLCFGTFGGWPRFAPPDLGAVIDLANALTSNSGRRVDWINFPTLPSTDETFYAPLRKLDPQGAKIYLGVIHNMDSFERRIELIGKYLKDFGYSAPCGFGRSPTSELPAILKQHLDAVNDTA